MNIFNLLTTFSYWILVVLWSFILIFYLRRIIKRIVENKLADILIIILAIDAFRTIFESTYFGFWYTSMAGIIPKSIQQFLIQPQYFIIPKLLNVLAAVLIVVLLIKRWIPEEDRQKVKQRQYVDNLEDEILGHKIMELKLSRSEAKYRNLLENIPQKIFYKDVNSVYIAVNPSYANDFGLKPDDFIGQNDYKFYPRELAQKYRDDDHNVVMTGKIKEVDEEYVVDGETKWVHTIKNPIFDEEGNPIGLLGIFWDITERKRTEKKLRSYAQVQKNLLSEVNHRVKNNLTSIIGMIHKEELRSQSDDTVNCQELLRGFASRIEGLLVAHTMLSRNQWKPLQLSEFIREIIYSTINGISSNRTVNVDINKSSALISGDQAQHLTLVINELVTNSIRHTKEQKTLNISVKINMSTDNVIIEFRDNGPGYSKEALKGEISDFSIGYEMLKGVVTKNMQGDIELFNENGAVCRITFKEDLYA